MPDPDEIPEAWTWRKSLAGVEQIPGGATWTKACSCHDACGCRARWWPNDDTDGRHWPRDRVFATQALAVAALAGFVTHKAQLMRVRASYLDRVAARLTTPATPMEQAAESGQKE